MWTISASTIWWRSHKVGTTNLHANFHSDMRSVSACFTQFQLPTKTASSSQQ